MLGRNAYTQDELDAATAALARQLKAYKKLARAVRDGADPAARAALEAFEPLFFNDLALALDRRFVHRVRGVTGKAGSPLNELELLVASLMDHGGALRTNNVIKYVPGDAVVGLQPGDAIALDAGHFERLSAAVLAEIDAKYVNGKG